MISTLFRKSTTKWLPDTQYETLAEYCRADIWRGSSDDADLNPALENWFRAIHDSLETAFKKSGLQGRQYVSVTSERVAGKHGLALQARLTFQPAWIHDGFRLSTDFDVAAVGKTNWMRVNTDIQTLCWTKLSLRVDHIHRQESEIIVAQEGAPYLAWVGDLMQEYFGPTMWRKCDKVEWNGKVVIVIFTADSFYRTTAASASEDQSTIETALASQVSALTAKLQEQETTLTERELAISVLTAQNEKLRAENATLRSISSTGTGTGTTDGDLGASSEGSGAPSDGFTDTIACSRRPRVAF